MTFDEKLIEKYNYTSDTVERDIISFINEFVSEDDAEKLDDYDAVDLIRELKKIGFDVEKATKFTTDFVNRRKEG